jgi:hypothetical protein
MEFPDGWNEEAWVILDPCGCVYDGWDYPVFCPACREKLSAEIKASLQAAAKETGRCIP